MENNEVNWKYILYKIGRVELNVMESPIHITSIITEKKEPFLFSEFMKIKEDSRYILSPYVGSPRDSESVPRLSNKVSEIKINQPFYMTGSHFSNGFSTSNVRATVTPNLFVTSNSVYYLMDENTQRMLIREEKLNKLI